MKLNLWQCFLLKSGKPFTGLCLIHLGLAFGLGMHQVLVNNRIYLEMKYECSEKYKEINDLAVCVKKQDIRRKRNDQSGILNM